MCSTKAEKNLERQRIHHDLDQKIEQYLQQVVQSENLNFLLEPLRLLLWKIWLKTIVQVILAAIFGYVCFQKIEFINWNLSAIGRLLMIEIIPFWDWSLLYNEKCLISTVPMVFETIADKKNENGKSFGNDCVVCENLDYIDVIYNTSFAHLNDNYLLRGLPIIISDSISSQTDHFDVVAFLTSREKLIRSQPCELQTSLMISQYGERKLKILFEIVQKTKFEDQYFLHFRNCEFDAVKETRLLTKRPYFYPTHLEPAYSSFILISQNYKSRKPKALYFKGLIIVSQLQNTMYVKLSPIADCEEQCVSHEVAVNEGESFVFTSDIWDFVYFTSEGALSITYITETFWNP